MVIFGAGASYDSVNIRPPGRAEPELNEHLRPPLANELFDPRWPYDDAVKQIPRVRYLAARLRALRDGLSLEETLERLLEERDSEGIVQKGMTALRFYLQSTLWDAPRSWASLASGATNYVWLVGDIQRYWMHRGPVCFVTFNYELLLEDACAEFGVAFGQMTDYIENRYALIRPHGAVNWAHPAVIHGPEGNVVTDLPSHPDALRSVIIESTEKVEISPTHLLVGTPGAGTAQEPRVPALSVPARSKDRFEMPDAHLDALRRWIPEVTHLLVIGWRGADVPFLQLWKQAGASPRFAWIVAGGRAGAEQVNAELGKYGLGPGSVSEHGFTQFLRAEEHRYFFERA